MKFTVGFDLEHIDEHGDSYKGSLTGIKVEGGDYLDVCGVIYEAIGKSVKRLKDEHKKLGGTDNYGTIHLFNNEYETGITAEIHSDGNLDDLIVGVKIKRVKA